MSKNVPYQINYEKAINKSINNLDMQVKAKHLRLVVMGTFVENGAKTFWRVAHTLPYMNNKIVAWKFCYVLHKVLREGHSFCCMHSQSHKTDLDKIGKAWYHLDNDFGKIIALYTKLLITKLEFHNNNPEFPNHLDATSAQLELIVKNSMTNYLQLSADIFQYLDHLLQFQESIFESMLLPISGAKTWESKLDPLILCVQESSQLYNHNVRILFILHAYMPTEPLKWHRTRFGEHFKQLKQFYSNVNKIQCLNSRITVPPLPENAPDFLIEANLEGLGSERKNRSECMDPVAKTPIIPPRNIIPPQNIIPKQVSVPKTQELTVGNLIDLFDSPLSHQKPTAAPRFLQVSDQMRIENQVAQNDMALKKIESVLRTELDPFDTSFLEYNQQTTLNPPFSPVIHQMYIENRITQESNNTSFDPFNTSGHALLSPISHNSTDRNSLDPFFHFNDPYDNKYLNSSPVILPTSHHMQTANAFPDRFGLPFIQYNDNIQPSAPPLPMITEQPIHVEAITRRDNHIQYLQHELDMLRHHNHRMESEAFNKLQEKLTSLERSLMVKEKELMQEKQTKTLTNEVISSPQSHFERNSFSAFENQYSKMVSEELKGRQQVNGNLIRTQSLYDRATTSDGGISNEATFEWDDEDEFDEVQDDINSLEFENKIRDIENQIDIHMQSKELEVWKNNRELFNIKTEILKMSLENLIKEKQTEVVACPEEKVKKGNLVNRKIQKVTAFLKDKRIKLKG